MSNPNLIPYRVMLHEEKGDKFQIVFDCQAESDDHAVEQAENAYPGCEIVSYLPFDESPLLYVVYSANEAAISDSAGFWSNTEGWVHLDQATRFSSAEKGTFNLPIATGQDARWVILDIAPGHDAPSNLPEDDWRHALAPGDEVWWNDPEHGISSGIYKVTSINAGRVEFSDTILSLRNASGSEAEVFASELSPTQPDGLYPVIDGDCGNGDSYGYATSKEGAMAVGNATFVDEVVDAYLADAVTLRDGSVVPHAWVALTVKLPQTARLRLTLDVTYSLNGESVQDMQANLSRLVEHAIGEGMLTGSTAAEVEEYSTEVVVRPEPLEEDALTDWMTRRIEDGELALGDIPVRLARYGLMESPAFVAEMRERMTMTS